MWQILYYSCSEINQLFFLGDTMSKMTAETVRVELLLTDARGVYIPRDFGKMFEGDSKIVNSKGEADKKLTELVNGLVDQEPYGDDSEGYWEDWTQVLDHVYLKGENGDLWSLHQDGDLRAINQNDLDKLDDDESEKFWEMFSC